MQVIDTIRVQLPGIHTGPEVQKELADMFEGFSMTFKRFGAHEWCGAMWSDPDIGTMGFKSSRLGGSKLWAESSLPKFIDGSNCRQLSVGEAREALDQWGGRLVDRYGPLFMDGYGRLDQGQVTRVDFYHQRHVPSSSAVCVALAGALKDRAKLAQYQTSVEVMQSRNYRGRWYDKGHESGNESYWNVLRHEEQIRSGNLAGYYVDLKTRGIRVEEARAQMNKRFEGWPESGMKVLDVHKLVREHGHVGLAAAALVLDPALEETLKGSVNKRTFYKYRNVALSCRRSYVNVDLRVPVDAWTGQLDMM